MGTSSSASVSKQVAAAANLGGWWWVPGAMELFSREVLSWGCDGGGRAWGHTGLFHPARKELSWP